MPRSGPVGRRRPAPVSCTEDELIGTEVMTLEPVDEEPDEHRRNGHGALAGLWFAWLVGRRVGLRDVDMTPSGRWELKRPRSQHHNLGRSQTPVVGDTRHHLVGAAPRLMRDNGIECSSHGRRLRQHADVDRLPESSCFPMLPPLRRRRPRISVQDVELDRTPHAGASNLAIPACGRRRKLLPLYSTAKLCVDPGKHIPAERDQRSHRLVQPLLIRVFLVESDVGPQRDVKYARIPAGGPTARLVVTSGRNLVSASIAETRVRGCHSGHCSPTHRRAQLWSFVSAGGGDHDAGSAVSTSNGPRSRFASSSSLRNASASDLVRNVLPRERPSTAHRTIQGLVAFSSLRRSCTPQIRTSCHDEICGETMGREYVGCQHTASEQAR